MPESGSLCQDVEVVLVEHDAHHVAERIVHRGGHEARALVRSPVRAGGAVVEQALVAPDVVDGPVGDHPALGLGGRARYSRRSRMPIRGSSRRGGTRRTRGRRRTPFGSTVRRRAVCVPPGCLLDVVGGVGDRGQSSKTLRVLALPPILLAPSDTPSRDAEPRPLSGARPAPPWPARTRMPRPSP